MAFLSAQDVFCLLLCIAVHFIYRYRHRPLSPYPPGLPRLPFVGNALSIPLTNSHLFYKELGERLGSKIVYLEAFGKPILVLNDLGYAKDLLEKRSAIYSSRPRSTMISDVAQIDFFFALMPYGDEWRDHRRLFRQYFSPKLFATHRARELEFVRKALLPDLYQYPHNVQEHIQNCVGGLAASITYGVPIRRTNDPLVRLADEAFEYLAKATTPGKYLVDIIPMLRHVPGWIPGATFQEFARECKEAATRVREVNYQATLKAMEDGTARDAFVSNLLERYMGRSDFEYQAQLIADTAVMIHGATLETTVGACMTFLLAMLLYPNVQQSAQQEIDSVVGHGRLPDFSDKPRLPYLSAILKEVFRWNPIAPLGFPHLTSDEDVYKGYYIPKGCIVMANIHAIFHDEDIFPNPKEFKPERFLKKDGILSDIPDPEVFAFGFGRRMCPGSHIGLSTLYIIAVSVLSLFDISPALDAEGNTIEVVPEWSTSSTISAPSTLRCKLVPRKGRDIENVLKAYMDFEFI